VLNAASAFLYAFYSSCAPAKNDPARCIPVDKNLACLLYVAPETLFTLEEISYFVINGVQIRSNLL
jgi:hypothetical protein